MNFTTHIKEMLNLGEKAIKNSPVLTKKTGNINQKGDETIGMDQMMEDVLINYIKKMVCQSIFIQKKLV